MTKYGVWSVYGHYYTVPLCPGHTEEDVWQLLPNLPLWSIYSQNI